MKSNGVNNTLQLKAAPNKIQSIGMPVVLASLAFGLLAIILDPTLGMAMLVIATVLSVVLPIAIVAISGRFTISVWPFLFVFFFITGPGRALYLASSRDEYITLDWYFIGIATEQFLASAIISCIFNVILAAGYAVCTLSGKPRPAVVVLNSDKPSSYELMMKIIILLGSCWAAYEFLDQTRGFGFFESRKAALIVGGTRFALGHFQILTSASVAVCVLSFIRIISQSRGPFERSIFVFSFFFIVWYAYVRSVRGDILLTLLMLLYSYWVLRGRIKIGASLLIGSLSFAMILGITLIRAAATGDVLQASGLTTILKPVFGEFNLGGFVSLYHAMRVVPSILDHTLGATYFQFLWLLIPRGIWPDKPLAVGEYWLAALNPDSQLRFGGGVSTGMIGEAYLNFGAIGLIVVPLVLGVVIFGLERFLSNRAGRPSGLALAVMTVGFLAYSSYGYFFAKGIIDCLLSAWPLLFFNWRDAPGGGDAQNVNAVTAKVRRTYEPNRIAPLPSLNQPHKVLLKPSKG